MNKSINTNDNQLIDCLSKLTQIHFYWLCCHVSRAFWLHDIDQTPVSENLFKFSRDELEHKFFTGDFEKLLRKKTTFQSNDGKSDFSVGEFLQEGWRTYLRIVFITQIQATLKWHLEKQRSEIRKSFLKKDHFTFFKEARDALMHSQGILNKRANERKVISLDSGVTIETSSGKALKIKDSILHDTSKKVLADIKLSCEQSNEEIDIITGKLLDLINCKKLDL